MEEGSVLRGHLGPVVAVAYSPDGRRLVTASREGTARVWDLATGTVLSVLNETWPIVYAAVAPDGRLIVTVSSSPEALEAGRRMPAADADGLVDLPSQWAAHVRDATTGRLLFPLVVIAIIATLASSWRRTKTSTAG